MNNSSLNATMDEMIGLLSDLSGGSAGIEAVGQAFLTFAYEFGASVGFARMASGLGLAVSCVAGTMEDEMFDLWVETVRVSRAKVRHLFLATLPERQDRPDAASASDMVQRLATALAAAGQPSPYSDAGQPAAPDPESAGLSPQWILSQLAGMSFPQKGQAYDFMKRAIEAQRGRS